MFIMDIRFFTDTIIFIPIFLLVELADIEFTHTESQL
jgi:hypothetical protein